MYLHRIGGLLAFFLVSLQLNAAEIDSSKNADSIWVDVNSQSGLITALPSVTPDNLIQQMGTLRADLQARKAELTRDATEKEFSVKDGIITAVMPGGLLYAAVKKQQHQEAVARVKAVDTQLADLNEDLIEYRSSATDALIVASTPTDQSPI